MDPKLKLLAVSWLLSTINYPLSTALAQGTAFTYQTLKQLNVALSERLNELEAAVNALAEQK